MSGRACGLGLIWLAFGCAATATSDPALREPGDDGGSSGTGTSGSGTGASTSTAGGPSAGGTFSAGGSGAAGTAAASGSSNVGTAGTHAGSGGSSAGATGNTGAGGSGNSGPVSVGLPFSETFESGTIAANVWTAVADQVPDPAAAKWSVVTDGSGKVAELQADSSERFLVGGNGAWTDQKLELRVKVVSGSPEIDIAFRYHALKEYYYLEFANAHFKVRDRTSANDDILPPSGTTKPPLVVGTWYKLTLQIKGTAVSASLNDMVVATGTFATTPIAAGGIAIGVGSGSGVVEFDDINVTLPP